MRAGVRALCGIRCGIAGSRVRGSFGVTSAARSPTKMWKWLEVSGRVSRCDAQLTRTSCPYSTRRSMDCSASAAHLQQGMEPAR